MHRSRHARQPVDADGDEAVDPVVGAGRAVRGDQREPLAQDCENMIDSFGTSFFLE